MCHVHWEHYMQSKCLKVTIQYCSKVSYHLLRHFPWDEKLVLQKRQGSHMYLKRRENQWSICEWSLGADWLIATRAYTGFCNMKRLGVFLLPLDGMLVHCRSLPRNLLGFLNNLPVPIYTTGWREAMWEFSVLPKNTMQCPWPGLEPRPLAPGTSTLTITPPRLQHTCTLVMYFWVNHKQLACEAAKNKKKIKNKK